MRACVCVCVCVCMDVYGGGVYMHACAYIKVCLKIRFSGGRKFDRKQHE